MKVNAILTRERVVLLVAGSIVLLAGLLYRFTPDIRFSSHSQKLRQVEKYQHRVDGLPVLEDRNIFLTGQVERANNLLISAGSLKIAGAEIQNMLREMAGQDNISFKSVKALKEDVKTYGFVSVIPVGLAFKANIRQLKDFLYRIETSSKMLAVTELRIIKPGREDTEELNVMITVQGYFNGKS